MFDDGLGGRAGPSSSSIRQGFICPFCFEDLGDAESLYVHVDRAHPDGTGEEDAINQIKKGILSHARKIKSTASSLLDRPGTSGGGGGGKENEKDKRTSSVHGGSISPKETRRSGGDGRVAAPILPKDVGSLGIRRPLMECFRGMREDAVHESAVRTNMLIIRLDKLINEGPKDEGSRKAFERSIVPWSEDSQSPLCTMCAAKFSLTRRRHHCRLCGTVICATCSRYLTFLSARKLTNPALAAQMMEALSEGKGSTLQSIEQTPFYGGPTSKPMAAAEAVMGLAKKSSGQLMSLLKSAKDSLEEDEGSVRSLQSQQRGGGASSDSGSGRARFSDAAEHLRVCPSCIGYLSRRETQMEQANPPAFVSMYEQLRRLITELANLSPSYERTAESLRNGETMYTLPAAEELRRKLVIRQKEIDTLSRRISDDFDEMEIGAEDVKVRKRIRAVALLELQHYVLSLPPLPSAEDYAKLVDKRKAEVARQVAESRARLEEASSRAKLLQSPSLPVMNALTTASALRSRAEEGSRKEKETLTRSASTMDEGWTPEQRLSENPFVDEEHQEHPLIVQRKQVVSFLQQAAEAGKVDDARILENNLRMIDEEIMRMGLETPRD